MSIINEMNNNKGVQSMEKNILIAWKKFIESKKRFAKNDKSLDKIQTYWSYNAGKLTPKEIKELRIDLKNQRPDLMKEFIENKDKYGLKLEDPKKYFNKIKNENAIKYSVIKDILKLWYAFLREKLESFFEIDNLRNNKTNIEVFTNEAKKEFIEKNYPLFKTKFNFKAKIKAEQILGILSTDKVKQKEKSIQHWTKEHAGYGHGP
jgi:hypothetical protein